MADLTAALWDSRGGSAAREGRACWLRVAKGQNEREATAEGHGDSGLPQRGVKATAGGAGSPDQQDRVQQSTGRGSRAAGGASSSGGSSRQSGAAGDDNGHGGDSGWRWARKGGTADAAIGRTAVREYVHRAWPGRTARAATAAEYESTEGEERGGATGMAAHREAVGRGQWAQGGLGVAGVRNGEANDVGDEEVEGGVGGDEAVQRVGLPGGRRGVHRATGGDEEEVR
nr:uncharacterized PE-PGRS family protein PE_PGRS54-like [Aegilops tauschii subsp. strangulata]